MSALDFVFVVGCPRSGTTWLQLLLAQHPSVTTSTETHLFPNYLAPLLRAWNREREEGARVGLSPILKQKRFEELCRSFFMEVVDVARRDKPEATVFVEKTPNHALFGDLILQLFPQAWFVHIVRDPRAVVSSILAASKDWGAGWAERDALRAARQWGHTVTTGHAIGRSTERFLEIRYEALHADPQAHLRQLVEFLPIEAPSEDFFERAVENCAARSLKKQTGASSNGQGSGAWAPTSMQTTLGRVARNGTIDGWRDELSATEAEDVEWELRKIMPEFGYAFERIDPNVPPAHVVRSRMRQKLKRMLGRA